MPISPKEAKSHVTAEEQQAFDLVVKTIDEYLPKVYQGGSIDIPIPKGILTSRMSIKLADAYRKAGWKQVSVDHNRGNVSLSEREPPDWER